MNDILAIIMSSGILAAILSSVFSSLAAVLQASATKLLSPLMVAALGNLLGGLCVAVCLFLMRKSWKVKVWSLHWGPIIGFILLRGIVGGILFNYGLKYTTGIKAIFFTKAEPYFVLLWQWLLDGKVIPKKHLALLLIHFAGAVILSNGGQFSFDQTQWGDFLMVAAVSVLAFSYRFGGLLSAEIGALQTNVLLQVTTGLILLIPALWLFPISFQEIPDQAWWYLGSYLILFNIFSLTLWLYSLTSVESWIVSALRAVGPLVAAPFAWYFLSQELTLLQIGGGMIVLVTSALIARLKA